jgi:hypothetical protein
LAIQSGRAKRHEWETAKSSLRTRYIGPKSRPEQHMAIAWREEVLAVKKSERDCCWSKHPAAQVTAMDKYYANLEESRHRCKVSAKNRYWRLRNDPAYRAQRAIRNTTSRIKRRVKKSRKSNELLGVSVVEAQRRLERQFQPGMTWQNHGKVWEIDHIYPLAAADLCDESQVLAVANIRNLRPLWKSENRAKAAKVLSSLKKPRTDSLNINLAPASSLNKPLCGPFLLRHTRESSWAPDPEELATRGKCPQI